MKEIWKPIPAYKGYYEVSSLGRIKNNRALILKLRPRKRGGYIHVNLYKNGYKSFLVHRLVLLAFVGDAKDMEANHKNHIPSDNRLENLEWISHKDNMAYKVSAKRQMMGEKHYRSVLSLEKIKELKQIFKIRKQGSPPLVRDIAKRFGVSVGSVQRAVYGKSWKNSQ